MLENACSAVVSTVVLFLGLQVLDYKGGRTYDDLVEYVDSILAGKKPKSEVEDVEDMGEDLEEDAIDDEDDGAAKDEL